MTATTADVILQPKGNCQVCSLFKYTAVVVCRKCKKNICNLHFCDVCRFCRRDCVCWERRSAVYHPPPHEPPPR